MSKTFIDRLLAPGPRLPDGSEALFGRFIGSWDIDVTWYAGGAAVRRARGEWHFAWVLGGRAVQDVWIVPTLVEQALGAPAYEHGTSLRFPVAGADHWLSQWSGPVNGLAAAFIARREGDEIVLDGTLPGGLAVRWAFHDIADRRFRWRNERAPAPGAPLERVQAFTATRQD